MKLSILFFAAGAVFCAAALAGHSAAWPVAAVWFAAAGANRERLRQKKNR